jgi:type I restriction enzyme S subunit
MSKKINLHGYADLIQVSINPNEYSDFRYLGLEHIEQQSLRLNGSGLGKDVESNKYLFKKGDILFGKLRPYFRKVIKAPYDGICSTDIWVLRAKNNNDSDFLFYLVASQDFINQATQTSEGTKMPRAKWEVLKNYEILVTNTKTQKEIGSILSTIDNKIINLIETNQTLESIAQAIFKSWFIDFDPVHAKQQGVECAGIDKATADLFPNSFVESELGLIPKDWKVGLLGDEIKIAYGKNLPTNKLLDVGYDVFGGNGKIGHYDQYIYETRQVLIACRGAASGAINQSTPKAFITNNSLILETNQNTLLTFSYIKGFMKRADLSPFVTGSAQPQVTIENIKMFKLLIPPKAVIDAYEDIVKIFEDKIQSNIYCINSFTGIRDTLLPRLISGKLDLSKIEERLEGVT